MLPGDFRGCGSAGRVSPSCTHALRCGGTEGDRERVHHGLDVKLYPPVRYVEITHLTPPGSPSITIIEVMSVNATVPEFYHVAGPARFKVTGTAIKSSNVDGK